MRYKQISGAALIALKEALTHIYWLKNDLKLFVNQTIDHKSFMSTIDMEKYKRQIAEDIVDRMSSRIDLYQEDLLQLLRAVTDISDFSHLKKWDDADKKIRQAQESVKSLRLHTQGYFAIQKEHEAIEERKRNHQNKLKQTENFDLKLEDMKLEFYRMSTMDNKAKRGFDFERFLNALFHLFDLDPKCSYKTHGEQIDGAFTHENQDYLVEAKWEKKPMPKASLMTFEGRVSGKLENTLGLYISISGFSEECKVRERSKVILMDYQDIISVIEKRIDLKLLIYRKKQHASQTAEILFHPY